LLGTLLRCTPAWRGAPSKREERVGACCADAGGVREGASRSLARRRMRAFGGPSKCDEMMRA
jgi:hypothetical protein